MDPTGEELFDLRRLLSADERFEVLTIRCFPDAFARLRQADGTELEIRYSQMSNRLSSGRRGWARQPNNPFRSASTLGILEDVHQVLPQRWDIPMRTRASQLRVSCETSG